MKKVIVIGSPGSGKSTFSRKLRDKTGLPLYYLDMIYHKADRTTVSREEFDDKLAEILNKNEWIIDGNYSRTIETRLMCCDTVILFDLPTDVCVEGAEKRVETKREDMPWIEQNDEEHKKFVEYIKTFKEERLPHIMQLINKYSGKEIIIFKSRNEADEFLKRNGEQP